MSRKDYRIIARAIADATSGGFNAWAIAEQIADALQRANPRFDRARFIAACGL